MSAVMLKYGELVVTYARLLAVDWISDSYAAGFRFDRERDGRWTRYRPDGVLADITVITIPEVIAELNRRATSHLTPRIFI